MRELSLILTTSTKAPVRSAKEISSHESFEKGFDQQILKAAQLYAKEPADLSTQAIVASSSNGGNSQDSMTDQEAASDIVSGRMKFAPKEQKAEVSSEKPQLNLTGQGERIPGPSPQASVQEKPPASTSNESTVADHPGGKAAMTGRGVANTTASHEKNKGHEKKAGVISEGIAKGLDEPQLLNKRQSESEALSVTTSIHSGGTQRDPHSMSSPIHHSNTVPNSPGRSIAPVPMNKEEIANRSSDSANNRTVARQHLIPQSDETREPGGKGTAKQSEEAPESRSHLTIATKEDSNAVGLTRGMQTPGTFSVKANFAEPSTATKALGKADGGFTRVPSPQASNAHQLLAATPRTLEVGVATNSHGWLKVRAELGNDGRVNALMSSRSEVIQQSLHKELGRMTTFLQSERVQVASLTVQKDFSGGRNAGLGTEANSKEYSGTSPDSQGGSRRTMPPGARQGKELEEGGEGREVDWPTAYDGIGSWLSVMA